MYVGIPYLNVLAREWEFVGRTKSFAPVCFHFYTSDRACDCDVRPAGAEPLLSIVS